MKQLLLLAPLTFTTTQGATLPAQFEGVAYGGGVVPAHGVVIDLASTAIAPRMPLLHEHVRDAIVGVVATASITDSSITVAGRLFSDMPGTAAEKIGQLAQRGAPFQLSVGLYGYSEQMLDAGQAATVNGRTVYGPVTILRRGTVREVSIVTLGADYESSARLFNSDRPGGTLNLREILARRRREAAAWSEGKPVTLHYGPAYIEEHHAAIVAAAPGLAEEIAARVGLVTMLKLLNTLGGVRIYFNRDHRPPAAPLHEAIVRAIGTDAAQQVYELMHGCGHAELPFCSGVERLLRNNAVRDDFDRGVSFELLIGRYRLTGRRVRCILHSAAATAPRCAPGFERDPIAGLLQGC